MKKILLATVAVGMLSTSAMAEWVDGTIDAVVKYPATTNVWVKKADNTIVKAVLAQDGDSKKEFLAIVLTAKAADLPVNVYKGPAGWTGIILK